MSKRLKFRQVNEVLWSLPLHEDPIASESLTTGASITYGKSPDGRDCLICVPGTSVGNSLAFIKQALTSNIPWGKTLVLKMRIRAAALTAPALPEMSWTYASAILGGNDTIGMSYYLGASEQGTYDWKEVNVIWNPNSDVANFQLRLGVSGGAGASGTLYISEVQILAGEVHDPDRPAQDPTYKQPGPQLRGFQLGASPSRDDFFKVRDTYGSRLIRFGIYQGSDYPQINDAGLQNVTTFKAWFEAKAQEVIAVRNYARQNGMKVVLNIGRMPGTGLDSRLSSISYILSSDYYMTMIWAWELLATMFAGDDTFLGFDIVNEPGYLNLMVPGSPEAASYHTGICDAIRAIRAIDPSRTIIAESFLGIGHPLWCKYGSVLPFDNVIYSAHVYAPGSSYNLSMSAVNSYPGFTLNNQQQPVYRGRVQFANPGLVIDEAYLRDQLQALRDFQLQYRVPIYIGEFGLHRWALGAGQWFADLCKIMNEFGWHYTQFEWNNGNFHPEFSATPVGGTGTLIGPTTPSAIALKAAMAGGVNPYPSVVVSPPSLTVADSSPTEAVLCWDVGTDPIDYLTVGYRVVGGAWTDYSVTRDALSRRFPGLTSGTVYEFRVTLNGTATGTATHTKATVKPLEAISATAKASVLGGWGLRILSSDYSGPIISVRRSSDGLVADIGATASGDLNETALTDHCAGGDGFITKWWDTTGKGQHREQATPGRQAQIVAGGVVNRLNAKPALKFAGGQGVGGGAIGMFAAGSCTIMGLAQQDAGNSGNVTVCGEFSSTLGILYQAIIGQAPGPTSEVKWYIRNDNSVVFAANVATSTLTNGFPVGSVGQFMVQDREHKKAWLGSRNVASPLLDVSFNSAVPMAPLTSNRFSIGARDRAALGFDQAGRFQMHELVIFGSVLSSEDEHIFRASQLAGYNTP